MAELTPADTVTVRRADLVQALADLDRAYQIFAEVDGLNPRYGTAYRNRLRAALEVAEAVRRRAAEAALAHLRGVWESRQREHQIRMETSDGISRTASLGYDIYTRILAELAHALEAPRG